MVSLEDKILCLKNYLIEPQNNYADSFKSDIFIYFEDFETQNSNFTFLNTLSLQEDIKNWVDKLTSKIVMKYNENEGEHLNDFIFDYINNN